MTNKERVLKTVADRAGLEPAPTGQKIQTPWNGKELKQFWAMARAAGMSKDAVHCLIGQMFPHTVETQNVVSLHNLTRGEFIRLMNDIALKQSGIVDDLDRHFIGKPVYPSWLRIRWLQRQIGWSNGQLVNYIKQHGKNTVKKIDHISWLTVNKAHGIITGMEKIRHSNHYRFPKEG